MFRLTLCTHHPQLREEQIPQDSQNHIAQLGRRGVNNRTSGCNEMRSKFPSTQTIMTPPTSKYSMRVGKKSSEMPPVTKMRSYLAPGGQQERHRTPVRTIIPFPLEKGKHNPRQPEEQLTTLASQTRTSQSVRTCTHTKKCIDAHKHTNTHIHTY